MSEQTLTRLKAARLARNWSAAYVVRQLREIATARGEHPYGVETVKRSLRLWENGSRTPAGWAVPLLEQCYSLSAAELGISQPDTDTQVIEQARAVLDGTNEHGAATDARAFVPGPRRQTSTGTWLRLLRSQHHSGVPAGQGVAS